MKKNALMIAALMLTIILSALAYNKLAPAGAPPVLFLFAKTLVITCWVMVVLAAVKFFLPELRKFWQKL